MPRESSCLFCRIIRGEIPAKKVNETESTFAFEDIHPQAPTHILVIPKKHIPSLAEIDESNSAEMGILISDVAAIARDQMLDAEGYRVVINCGPAAGQTVYHIHAHILGGRSLNWPPG